MKPRGEYLSRLVGEVIQIWLPPMAPEAERRVDSVLRYKTLVPEKPTGRGYVYRPIRSIANM